MGPRTLVLQFIALGYAFTAAAFHSDWPSIADEPWALARLAIPAGAGLLALILRDAFGSPEERPHYATALDVAIAFCAAFLTQVALSRFSPELALPRWYPTQGGLAGFLFLALLRALAPVRAWELPSTKHGYIVCAILLCVATPFTTSNRPTARAGAVLLIAGAMFLAYRIHSETRATLFQDFWLWYCGSLLPGAVLLVWGSKVYAWTALLYLLLIGEFALRGQERRAIHNG